MFFFGEIELLVTCESLESDLSFQQGRVINLVNKSNDLSIHYTLNGSFGSEVRVILKVTLGAAAAMAEGLPVPDEWYNSALFTDYVALFTICQDVD